jgi:4-diphosphocytidyl-2-C-methyl-D-erythritol kinase
MDAVSPWAIECDHPAVPVDGGNLVSRAAHLLAARAGRRPAGRCRLLKRIPLGGGLGGGSSDAAATLVALNRIWELHWPRARLVEIAAELGSDVALFLENGSAVIRGRGEKVTPVRLGWRGWIVLLLPGLHVSTPAVYRAWRPGGDEPRPVEPVPAGDAAEWMKQTFNMLEAPAIEVCPELGELQGKATSLARRDVRISGSGSTLFTAFNTRPEAEDYSRSAGEVLKTRAEVVQPTEQA